MTEDIRPEDHLGLAAKALRRLTGRVDADDFADARLALVEAAVEWNSGHRPCPWPAFASNSVRWKLLARFKRARTNVEAREVVSALLVAMRTGGLLVVDRSLAAELRDQLEKLKQWREKDDPEGAGGDLAVALALATWSAARDQRRLEAALPRRSA